MKIVIVVPWFPSSLEGSIESQQGIFEYRQLMKLAKRGNEFKVISIKWRGQCDYEFITDNIEVYRISSAFTFPKIRYPVPKFITFSRKIKQVYRNWNPDLIIYSHMIYLTTLPIFWLKKPLSVPSIVTTDAFPGISWFWGNKIVDGIGYLYSMLIGRRIFPLADGVQLMSSKLSEYAEKLNISRSKIFDVPRGVDTELFRPINDQGRLRSELGTREDDIVVLYVGRLDLVKGVTYLLQASKRVLPKRDNLKFLIVGDGSLRREFERFAQSLLPNIIFTGWRNDIPRLMNIADIFILPSLSEGAANVVMEASASGLPVIATEVGEVPQIVANGETGILIKPKDVDGLVSAIEKLIAEPLLAKKMGEAGRKRIEQKYSWEVICDKLEKAYRDVVERFKASRDLPEVKD